MPRLELAMINLHTPKDRTGAQTFKRSRDADHAPFGDGNLSTPLLGVVCHPRLGLAMFNPYLHPLRRHRRRRKRWTWGV